MKSEIERIRSANFKELDRRMLQNNCLLEAMKQSLTDKKAATPIARLCEPATPPLFSRLRDIQTMLLEVGRMQKAIRQQTAGLAQSSHKLAKQAIEQLIEQIRSKDQAIKQLQSRIDRYEMNVSLESSKLLESTQSQDELFKKGEELQPGLKEMQLHANASISARALHSDTSGALEPSRVDQKKREASGVLQSHRIYAHSRQQLAIPEALMEFPTTGHKRNISSQNSFIVPDQGAKDALRKKASELFQRNEGLNIAASFAKASIVGIGVAYEGFQMHSTTISHASTRGGGAKKLTERVENKQNGPILPKPLRKNSVDAARSARQDEKMPEPPHLSMPIVGKGASDNGFGVWEINGVEMYRGLWKNGVFDGRGKLKGDGWLYQGEFRNGQIDGNGILAFGQGYKWVGKFSKNRPDGQGCLTFSGRSITGVWRRGVLQKKSSDSSAFP